MEIYEGTSNAAIGARLKLTREVFGLGQTAFCKKAGITQNAYSQYEAGTRRPIIENAIKLVETYNLTLDWVYRGEPSGLNYSLNDALRTLKLTKLKNNKQD